MLKPASPLAPPPVRRDATYENIGYLLLTLLAVVVFGFYRTYFGLFPAFKGITTVQHLHGMLMLSWFGLLIVQPFLIKHRRLGLHRVLGRVSYGLVPLLLLSMWFVTRGGFLRQAAELPLAVNIGGLALNLPSLPAFAALFGLAMYYRKNRAYHMRYMVATALLLLGPGLGRAGILYIGLPFPVAVEWALGLTDALAAGLLLSDVVRRQPLRPYLVALTIVLAMHLVWEARMMAPWQAFGGFVAQLFF